MEMRAEGFAVELIDNHRIGISLEAGVKIESFTIRAPRGREAGEYHDLIIQVQQPMLDGADAERDDQEWCFLCAEWFPKGTHLNPDWSAPMEAPEPTDAEDAE